MIWINFYEAWKLWDSTKEKTPLPPFKIWLDTLEKGDGMYGVKNAPDSYKIWLLEKRDSEKEGISSHE